MSRIVIDARELRTSSGRYVERLLHYLQDLDIVNDYRILLKPEDIAGWQPKNPKFKGVSCPHKEFTFSEQTSLLAQVKNLNADLVHWTFPQQPVAYKGASITTVHDLTTLRFTNPDKNRMVFKFKQGVYSEVIKRVARKSVTVLTPTEFVKQDLAKFSGINLNNITVTPEAADPIPDTPTPLPDLQKKQFIMYIGRPTPHKNLSRLIEAFSLLHGQHPDLHLVLAGKKDGNYQRIEAQAAKKGVKNVVFTDFISDGQLRWLYENCQAYVFPSLSEGFGLPGLEAMVHGAPVVSSDATCLPEVYGEAAHYFNPKDTQAMADAINEVLTDKSLRQQLVSNGQQQTVKYSWERMAEQTLQAYRNALQQ